MTLRGPQEPSDFSHLPPSDLPARTDPAEAERIAAIMQKINMDAEACAAHARSLPCHGLAPDDAITACEAANAWHACPFRRSDGHWNNTPINVDCPRDAVIERYRKRVANITNSGLPARYHDLLRAMPRWREAGRWTSELEQGPGVPAIETTAMIAARAFASRKPTTKPALKGDETFLILAGPVGVGKSLAAAWLLAKLGGKWIRAADLVRIKGDEDPTEAAAVGSPVVIDDLGQEHVGASDYALSTIDRVLSARYDANQITIITTNLNRADFRRRYSARLDDRINECGAYVECLGKSLRGAT